LDYVISVNGGDLTMYNLEITYNSTARITSILIDDQTVYEGNVGSGDFIQLPVAYTLVGGEDYKITYIVSSNINRVSFLTLLNPECENEHYDFAAIEINN